MLNAGEDGGIGLAIELTTDNLGVYGYANPPTHYVR